MIFQVGANKVVKGLDEGVTQMTRGEKAVLTCSPELGYGEKGVAFGLIPPNSTLAFEVELLAVEEEKTE